MLAQSIGGWDFKELGDITMQRRILVKVPIVYAFALYQKIS